MFYDDQADYLYFLPDKIASTEEARAIAEAINPEIDLLSATIKMMANDKNISTASITGIARWEDMLGINPVQGATLEQRRDAVKSKLISKPPINLRRLEEVVSTYLGVPATAEVKNYILTIWYRGAIIGDGQDALQENVERIIPANLVLKILYNYIRWGAIKPLTWGQLKQKTWQQVRMEE